MHRTSWLAAAAVAAALQSMTGQAAAAERSLLQLAQAATPLPIPQAQNQTGTAATPAPAPAPAAKDQSQIPPSSTAPTGAAPTPPAAEQAPAPAEQTPPAAGETPPAQPDSQAAPGDGDAAPDNQAVPDDQSQTDDADQAPDDLSLGEIPVVEVMELTPDIAKRALDSYLAAKEKYADAGLDQFENLQDFVDQTDEGKKFEADVKAAGFANVTEWNLAITSLTVMYGSVLDNQDADLQEQIKEVEGDTEMAQDMKDRMIKSIRAMIPSANNRKIIEDLMADPVYGDKLKQLDTGGEEE